LGTQIDPSWPENETNPTHQCGYATILYIIQWIGKKRSITTNLANGAVANTKGGYFGKALRQHQVQRLMREECESCCLEKGADVNAQEEKMGNATASSISWSHEAMV